MGEELTTSIKQQQDASSSNNVQWRMVCMKVGDTVYQMPLCGIPSATLDTGQTSQLLASQDPVITPQGNGFLELSIAAPVADGSTSETLQTERNLPDVSKLMTPPTTQSSSGSSENKRKGGWPKGKRRKPDIGDKSAPKAPTSGYVLFAIERRKKIEDENPHLFFPEITKILGSEWSSMPASKKQKYLDQAEEDKKRYMEELRAYQKSEAYQDFIKRKKLNNTAEDDAASVTIDVDDDNTLCCKVCDKYFNSLHNKKEHMLGKLHLQKIKGEYELERYKNSQKPGDNLSGSTEHAMPVDGGTELTEVKDEHSAVDIDSFIHGFLEKNVEREIEIKALKESLESGKELNIQYGKQITEMRDLDMKLEQDLATMKAYGSSLSAQIDMLKMVPTLFGVINF